MTRLVGPERTRLASRAAIASVAVATLLLAAKAWASVATHSTAMLGSLADTTLDLIASLVTLAGIRIAALPADHDHRFGHGKAEALVALAQVVLIAASAIGIAWRAGERLVAGAVTTRPDVGIGVSLLAIVVTFALIRYQRSVVAQTGSVAIHTDKIHYSSDLALNGAVIAALALDQLVHVRGADAAFGLMIAGWLMWGAWRAAGRSVDQLMDKEWPLSKREAFLAAVTEYPVLSGIHDVRTRSAGAHDFIQFHLWVPAHWTIREAHDRIDPVEEQLQDRFPGTEILIHLDPEGHTDRETMLPQHLTEAR